VECPKCHETCDDAFTYRSAGDSRIALQCEECGKIFNEQLLVRTALGIVLEQKGDHFLPYDGCVELTTDELLSLVEFAYLKGRRQIKRKD